MMDEQRPKNDNRCPAFSEAARAKNVMRANKNVYRFYVIDRGELCELEEERGLRWKGRERRGGGRGGAGGREREAERVQVGDGGFE